ncbi:MAG: XRE family transcriptional regulator [Acidobacteria bacterium]|nr:XRE family transcriptional regulator [Acidobacteriota bacterium]
MRSKSGYTVSSGNVFADLGFPNAEEMLAKAELAHKITAIIQRRGLTQARAAALLGVDQPKVSALKRGRLSGFSLERLVRFLILLGRDVQIVVRQRRLVRRGRARLLVA